MFRPLLSEGAIKETSVCPAVYICNSKVLVTPYEERVRELEECNRSRLN